MTKPVPSSLILVVDDDEEYLYYMREAMTRAGHECVLTASAQAAQETLQANRFALVITDLRLPGSSGLDVMSAARRIDPLTVCIVMTAFGTIESALEALRGGAYDFLLKPCAADVMEAAVRRALEHYRLRCELIEKTARIEAMQRDFQKTYALLKELSGKLEGPLSAQDQEQMRHLLLKLVEETQQ